MSNPSQSQFLGARFSRRQALKTASAGFGYLALAGMLGQNAASAAASNASEFHPLAAKAPAFPVKAKRVIFLFMQGAISQVDTIEYKPQLQKDDQKVAPGGGVLTASKFKFSQYGQTGTWISELFPHMARHVDKFCFLRGLHTDTPASMGSWLLYGLGTENQDLPGYITINPPPQFGGATNYGSAFLPAYYQGTRVSDTGYVPDLQPQGPLGLQRKEIDLVQSMNRDFASAPGATDQLEGVIQSYELAFKMQRKVPELLDISKEPRSVLDAYGVKPGPAGSYARQCLMARRLSEAGVRFVEICHPGWDQHNNLHQGLIKNCAETDQPTAALMADLEQRGLLDETLVIFGSEFGRLPSAQGPDGRDHNITGYPMWLAGAGVRKGFSYGATDEYGTKAVDGQMHTNDLHATLLALMGLDHEKLTYRYAGRDFRLTNVAGKVAQEIMA
jgi:hypothetical protein